MLMAASAFGAEHQLVVTSEGPPVDVLSKEVAATLQTTGLKIMRGTTRTVCEIWFCKTWEVKEGFKETPEVLYPFQSGQLIGVLRYTRKGSDFRDETIDKGVYTLRYGQQPVDGNHEGTSVTRDFLCLIKAEKDVSTKPFDLKPMLAQSAEAAGSGHPAFMCLKKVKDKPAKLPAVRHDDDTDWWSLLATGQVVAGGKGSDLVVELVVIGHADE